ncbi:hypothetical protein EUGRSUZ_D02087 [Eucalyptus grandis]|uniref:Uncharacterized protein n=2 Tax=Eucalyptus grandis TaxID=71139 RepID=A0ACC3L7I8_EUCGR|nr:hypothetical protein EUGRSUZ_D02087 [Eucalyptus grandis]
MPLPGVSAYGARRAIHRLPFAAYCFLLFFQIISPQYENTNLCIPSVVSGRWRSWCPNNAVKMEDVTSDVSVAPFDLEERMRKYSKV